MIVTLLADWGDLDCCQGPLELGQHTDFAVTLAPKREPGSRGGDVAVRSAPNPYGPLVAVTGRVIARGRTNLAVVEFGPASIFGFPRRPADVGDVVRVEGHLKVHAHEMEVALAGERFLFGTVTRLQVSEAEVVDRASREPVEPRPLPYDVTGTDGLSDAYSFLVDLDVDFTLPEGALEIIG